ncbi:MAG: hypothetical protein R2932_41380 [Caldilineaceae bacterium]
MRRVALRNFALIDLDEANWHLHNGKADAVDQELLQQLAADTATAGMRFETVYARILIGQLAFHQAEHERAAQVFSAILTTLDESNPH